MSRAGPGLRGRDPVPECWGWGGREPALPQPHAPCRAGGEGRASLSSLDGATHPGQPQWLRCQRDQEKEGGCLWPRCREGVRCSHSQVPPSPRVSSFAVIGVGVRQPSGGLGAGLDRLHPLLQAAAGEHHVAGADTLRPGLPQVLLAVPDAVTEVHEQACSGGQGEQRLEHGPAAGMDVASIPAEQHKPQYRGEGA